MEGTLAHQVKLVICIQQYLFNKKPISLSLLLIVSLLISFSENRTAPKRPNCDVLQCRWIFHCPAWQRGNIASIFAIGSLLSRQPPVKTHDHHSSSLYHHNVPHTHCLTISYTLKFMTSSQCRN